MALEDDCFDIAKLLLSTSNIDLNIKNISKIGFIHIVNKVILFITFQIKYINKIRYIILE